MLDGVPQVTAHLEGDDVSERDRIAEVLQERARDCEWDGRWDGTFRLAGDIARYLATPIAEEVYELHTQIAAQAQATEATVAALRNRCLLYNEAVTILLECDHGDAECGCRDRAMERLVTLLPRKEQDDA